MPEPNMIMFTYKELAEALIKRTDIHEGFWGIWVKFGLNATNVDSGGGMLTPSAVVGLAQIGIQRFEKANSLTVDAREVNPLGKNGIKTKGRSRTAPR